MGGGVSLRSTWEGVFSVKQYEYVHIRIGKFIGAKLESHREIIDEYASRGFTYAGYIPTNITDYGKFKEIDLIFEKDR